MDSGLNDNKYLAYAGITILVASFLLLLATAIIMGTPRPQRHPSPLPTPTAVPIQLGKVAVHRLYLPLVSGGHGKGIGLTYGHCADALAVGAVWQYGWTPQPRDCSGVESVPMIRDRDDVGNVVTGSSDWLLGFNEPDRWNQGDLSPEEAAELWREVEFLYGDDWLLVGPAVSHTALVWLEQFYEAYNAMWGEPPTLDALAVHCYANDVDECIATVQEVIAMADNWQVLGGVWVTEFAFWPTQGEGVPIAPGKAREFLEWLGGERRVTRYAWFAARIQGDEWWAPNVAAPLVEFESGELTMYGVMYAE